MLTELLLMLTSTAAGVVVFIWIAERLGVHKGIHDLFEDQYCPCGAVAAVAA